VVTVEFRACAENQEFRSRFSRLKFQRLASPNHRDPQCPVHVDSRRRSNVSNAQIPVIPKRRGEWVKSTHNNGLRCDAKNQRAAIEFHIDSADLRVLEFIKLVSPTEVWRVA
jgi:hypothetical protein